MRAHVRTGLRENEDLYVSNAFEGFTELNAIGHIRQTFPVRTRFWVYTTATCWERFIEDVDRNLLKFILSTHSHILSTCAIPVEERAAAVDGR